MLILMVIKIYSHPMFWWFIVPLVGTGLLVAFMLWESRLPKNLGNKKKRSICKTRLKTSIVSISMMYRPEAIVFGFFLFTLYPFTANLL